MLSVAIVLFPPRSMMLIAGATCVLTFAALPWQTKFAPHFPPVTPHSASVVQFVVHFVLRHEPTTAPGHSASTPQVFAAGPVNMPCGPFGAAPTDITYPKPPWTVMLRSWFGKQPAVPPLWSLKPMSTIGGSSTTLAALSASETL